MPILYIRSKKKQTLFAGGLSRRGAYDAQNLSLRGLRNRVRRADQSAAGPYAERLEPQVGPAPLAFIGSDWPVLCGLPCEARAHNYRQRASRIRSSHSSGCLISPHSLRAQSLNFSRLSSVADGLRAPRAGNPGVEPATDEAGRPSASSFLPGQPQRSKTRSSPAPGLRGESLLYLSPKDNCVGATQT